MRSQVQSAFQVHPKAVQYSRAEQKVFMDLALRTPSHAGTCLSLLVPAKADCNADTTAYIHCIPTAHRHCIPLCGTSLKENRGQV